jgi:hypothetical protein
MRWSMPTRTWAPLPADQRRLLAVTGIAAWFAVSGISAWIIVAPETWAEDARRNLAAAQALLDGHFGTVEGYLYSPLAALLTAPFTLVPEAVAIWTWLAFKAALVVVGGYVAVRGRPTAERVAAAIAAVAFLPILYDLELGNVTVLLVAAMAFVAWRGDGYLTGVPLGLVLATAPKPQLIFFLLWMVLYRRRSLVGALATAVAATGLTVLVVGLDPYRAWIEALRAPTYLSGSQLGNKSLTTLPPPLAAVSIVASLGLALLALRRGRWPALAAALALGLLVSPYTLVYAAGVFLVAAPALWMGAPGVLLALALVAPVGLVVAFPAWVGAALVAAAVLPREAWHAVGRGRAADPVADRQSAPSTPMAPTP